MAETIKSQIAAVRKFNRFYTRKIGLLNEGLLNSPFSLTETRILYELSSGPGVTARDISRELGINAGYLSRMLAQFENRGLIRRSVSSEDRRKSLVSLSAKGTKAFAPLNERSDREVEGLLRPLGSERRRKLIASMDNIGTMLGQEQAPSAYVLRQHRPGDMGWIVHRHGQLYYQEYGWDERFEALVAEIAAAFIKNYDPARERCWIAEREGEILGSVFLVSAGGDVAKLRMLYVEPAARGMGIGKQLVSETIRFARDAKYRKITLWTNSVLLAARGIYQMSGFRKVHEETTNDWGKKLIAETWELEL